MHPKNSLITFAIFFLLLIASYAVFPTWENNETLDYLLGTIFILILSWFIISCIYWVINRAKGNKSTTKFGSKHYKSKSNSLSSSDL